MSQIPVEIVRKKSQVPDVVTPDQPPTEIPVEIVRSNKQQTKSIERPRFFPYTRENVAVEKVEEVEKQRPVTVEKRKLIAIAKPVFVPVERPKLRRKLDYSPEEEVATSTSYAPKISLDYNFSPSDFLSSSRTFAPRLAYYDEYAPENFTAVSEVFSPSTSIDSTFAPKYESLKRSVYSPLIRRKTKLAPQVEEKIGFKPRLFDKLLAIFAPEAIIKQKSKVDFQPYNYQYTQTAIIDAYSPEQITTVDKFAPKDESNFKLRIAPVTELFIKTKPSSPMFSTTIYIDLLKSILR